MCERLKQQRISAKGGCFWCQLSVVNLTKLRKTTVFIEQDQRESCGNEGLRTQFYFIYLFWKWNTVSGPGRSRVAVRVVSEHNRKRWSWMTTSDPVWFMGLETEVSVWMVHVGLCVQWCVGEFFASYFVQPKSVRKFNNLAIQQFGTLHRCFI